MATKFETLPKAFVWRRLHSLAGLWLVIFLIEHLITNSQAALLLGENGKGFIRMVNAIHNLPYLTVIEVALLGIPILIHGIWGIRYALTAKFNSTKSDGSTPYLKYSRNKAYTLQRITSWILVVLLTVHIVKFRFVEYPVTINSGSLNPSYLVKVTKDPGIYGIAKELGATLYFSPFDEKGFDRFKLTQNEVIVAAPSFGTASLFSVRDTFKNPWWVGVYTIFVLSAVFHAFNGLWTSMLTWGWVIKATAQTRARQIAIALMIIIAFLGLAAVWGTYFLNLRG